MTQHYPFINTPLPYAYNALEPYIDTKTMMLHHDKHLQTYIDNLNAALKDYPRFHDWTLEQLIVNIPSLPKKIQTPVHNNAGGVYNHQFYFANLTSAMQSRPIGLLREAIVKKYGDFVSFQKELTAAALSVFGSGYAWLVVNAQGALQIITTANQDTPLPLNLCPVLNVDVWEHAYYLKHYNLRADYIDDWFHVINWDQANANYLKCFLL